MSHSLKRCSKCRQEKSCRSFHLDASRKGGRDHRCKACRKGRVFSPKHKVSARANHFQRLYGLSLAERDFRIAEQAGVCAICKGPPRDGQSLHMDHDHKTGSCRRFLCSNCNRGLGLFRDNPELLEAAARYLREPSRFIDSRKLLEVPLLPPSE